MNLNQFLAELAQRGIKLWLEGDTLRFRAPKGVMTSEDRDLLVLNKAKIISLLSQSNTSTNDTDQTIVPVLEQREIPLSFPQEQLWFLSQLDPNNVSYNELFALRFLGVLNIVALEQSLNKIVARHAALRTNFATVDGQPVQVIAESLILTVPVIDLSNLPASDRENEVQRLATERAQKPFDLVSDPLIQATVLKLTDTEYIFLLRTHHIVWDGWSLGIMSRELAAFYNDLSQELPPLPAEYPDFAVWQKQYLTGEVLDSLQTYWQQQLLDAPPLLELPTDRARGVTQTFRGKHYRFVISKPLTEALSGLSRRQKVTLFMTLLAAFQTLLYRYTGQDDIVVGSPIANRDRSEFKDLIGYFVNTLVLRTCLAGNPSFEDLLSRVRKVTLEAYAHRELPFEKLVEILQPERSLSYTPLFQVMLMLLNELPDIQMEGLKVSPLAVETGIAPFDLTLCIETTPSGLIGEWEYNTDLFDDATIARMAGHFQTLLEGIVANPQAPISDLPLLPKAEQQQLLVEWNSTWAEYPQNKCIHQLFEEQVEQTPDAVAVVFVGEQLTYRELNAKANQLAHYLRSLGVEPEVLVGICVERSLEMVVGLLGILKAGGAYVPLDPAYPGERLAFMLEDSAVPVLLTQQRLVDKLPQQDAQVVCLDTQWEIIAQHSEQNIACGVNAENLAYVIYTSGSTGKPKGVTIQHRSLVNYTTAVSIEYEIEKCDSESVAVATLGASALLRTPLEKPKRRADRILQFSSISFDVSAEEIYTSLTSGATLVLRTESMLDSIGVFLQKCRDWEITVLALPTAYWHELTARFRQETFALPPSLRLIIIGGEKALPERLKTWHECVGQRVRLVNNYGPTEATVGATIYDCSAPNPASTEVPIGRPIRNVQTYILDRNQQPVPIGVPGELHIGGAGLARGYLNHPDLTQAKFIPNSFSNEPGLSLYKTGDLARYLPDGNIEYLGRIDNQVKIRSFRIELGEIETAISQHPSVKETVVIAAENNTGNKQLVAYIVPQTEVAPSISDLRHFLKQKLPDYMIPAAFVMLDNLPLTPNGKVDRRALPEPELRPELELTFVAPRTPIEEMLANIWAWVLGIEKVGVHNNFFELGGHSLLAAQVISRARDTMSVELPLRSLFEAPTVATLAEHVENSLHSGQSIEAQPLLPIPRSGDIPLSFAQARLWFLDQLQPDSAFYNIPIALHLSGQLNVAALESSLNEIIRRHEVLRTNFTKVSGQPVQVIASTLKLKLLLVDLQNLPFCEREVKAQRLVTTEAERPFDLEREPLVRAKLLQLDETEYVFVLTVHHIIFDGWSTGVFYAELAALYEAFCTGKPKVLPELPVQYADFAVWQRHWLTPELLETQLNYWKQQLWGAPALLELPTDRPRRAVQSYRGAYQSFALSLELSQALANLSKRAGVTLFMTLYAAFVTLLYRYTGESDIVVGTPVANRNRQEIEELIGFFVNTLVLRTDLSANPSFEELLGRVREVALGAYAHQDLPFEQLVEALQPERSLSYTPLFQVMFALDEKSVPSMELPDLTFSSFSFETGTTKFDLTLSMENTASGLIGGWEYNSDLFDAATIARYSEHFLSLLEGIVANPIQPISQLPLLTQRERQQLLVEWNNTWAEFPQDKCIHQLFEEQVERSPSSVAVVFEGEQLTYKELNQRANKIAHHLQRLGVGPEVLVGICVERSLEMVVGLLGILKVGGAYVPLDPAYPTERLAYLLNDSQVSVILTQEKFFALLGQIDVPVLSLDTSWEIISQESSENPVSDVKPENLAYVIYTSGSTGNPKGVLINHHNVVRLFAATRYWFNFSERDVWTLFHSYAFDFSVWEIVGALIYGGKLVVVPYWVSREPEAFYDLLETEKVTVLNQTPSAFRQLIKAEQSKETAANLNLRLVIFGGEALELQSLLPWFERHGDQLPQLVNMYGITETTVHVTYRPLTRADLNIGGSMIGSPIPDLQVYILDQNLQPVPIGVKGEIHVGGAGLARGYLNRPDLTASKFIPNPWSDKQGARLYKTGDLARYLSDGNIEFLGRIDNQVKIRGFRIELGEIETAISQHPLVKQTVVIANENNIGNKQLVAYLVPQTEVKPTISDLRHFLKQQLPDYMIPSAFITLDNLPLTQNGKIDHRALPVPEIRPKLELTFVAPRTLIEEILANIWENVLGIKQIGINDNFFALGGHSLLAAQVISRVRDTISIELPLRSLFEAPTIAEFASRVENLLKNGQSVQAEPLLPIPRSESIPLSFAQARLWFLDRLQPNSAFYNIPLALRLIGQLNIAGLQSSINAIIQRHEALRTNFVTQEGQPVQVIASTKNLKLLVVDLLHLPESKREIEAQRLAKVEANRPFNLEREPLLRGTVLQLGETEYVLLLTMHHIISDGWSLGVFVRELTQLYKAFCTGAPPSLPELPVQYADFAVWQRQWLQGEILVPQLDYWKEQLLDAPALLELPTDRPRPAVLTFRGGYYYTALSLELSAELTALSKRAGVTLFMTLFAAFVTLLYRYSGQDDIVVGTPVANRNRREIEGLIGFFVNTLVLRTDLSGNPSFEQLLGRVKEVALGAYAHQDLPFEQLVEALQPTRDLSYTPLFQVMFALDDASVPSVELPELAVSSYPVEIGTAKFDLTLSMENTADGLIGVWEYNADLFDEVTIARMAGHFQTLLEAIAANPIQPISELPLLTQRERHQLLVEWNNTTIDYPFDKCIHQLFEEQVALTPDAVALVFEGEQLTYGELNRRANKLAHYLQSLGVGPEVLVGLCVERSFDMIIGLLGILKAGGAYVPIDPAYPPFRIAYMLDDSRLPVLLTQQKLVASLPEHQARVVGLDCDWQEICVMPELPPISDVTPENLTYVIYTSGSTGKPKGVKVAHRGLCNLAIAIIKLFDVQNNNSCVLQFASLSFDVSIGEIVMALCAGATLCLGTQDELQPGQPLLELLQKQKITHIGITPSALAALPTQELPALETIIAWGEPCPTSLVAQWASGRRFFNGYGPTESTVIATVFQCFEGTGVPPIGRPIDNTQVYILDRYLQAVPIGVPGELYIASVGLARGYLNRPDLTQEKFIPNPFSNEPGLSLYKTGDKARYLPDGNIEFLGRIDNQVKIRGFRIELGEVEEAITQHPAVRETVVVAREDTPGNKRLVAYVVPKGEAVQETVLPTVNELRSFLKTKLPDYMVPGAFVFLETMPLTPNGKIDRRTLPAPDSSLRELENNFVAPSTPTEETLAAIWAEVLGLQKVGIHDNFFELGGHSLLATSVISRIQEAFKIELPLRHLFEAPTIASLSQVIETVRQAGFIEQFSSSMTQDVLPPLVPTARDTHIPLSFAQEYIWYVQQLNPDSCICNSGVPLRFNGSLSPEVLEKSINEIIRRHEILRTTFTVKEGQPMQVIAPSLTLPLKIVDLQDLPVAEREACAQRLVAEEFQHHFDLANGPLIKTTLLRLARLEHWLLIPMHHIITDGWSIGIFLQELETLYNAFSNGLPSPLPEVPLQYADFALWEQKRLNEQVLDKQLSYWLQKLADSPQPQNVLPSQQLQPTTNSRQASFFSLVLPESLVASISALSRTHGVTTFAIIITALKILLFKWSGQTEILVVATTGNRSTPEIERILGCFINDVILRSLLADSQTGLTLLEQVKETVNEAINHKEVPLQKVIEAVRSKRELTLRASVTMEPPVQGLDGMSEWEFIPDSPKCELWDEEIPLELYVSSPTEDSQTLEIALFYSTELFTNETIERLFSYYQEILQKLVEYPETKVSEF